MTQWRLSALTQWRLSALTQWRLSALTVILIGLVGYGGLRWWNEQPSGTEPRAQIRLGIQADFDGDGVFIMYVQPGSWAWLVGLEIGDRITHVNGRPIKNKPVWVRELNESDGVMTLTVLRGRTQRVEPIHIVM